MSQSQRYNQTADTMSYYHFMLLGHPVSVMGLLAAGSQMDQQVAAALQQQEMQLLTALHLKQHEERLSALQVRQQEMLQHQEQQLEELIRRQMERQEQLNVHVRSQQERIDSHIQVMFTAVFCDWHIYRVVACLISMCRSQIFKIVLRNVIFFVV